MDGVASLSEIEKQCYTYSMSVYVFLNNDYADWELGYLLPELVMAPDSPKYQKNRKSITTFGLPPSR